MSHSPVELSYEYLQQARDGKAQHPYATNRSWQRNLTALKSWLATLPVERGNVLEVGCSSGRLQDLTPHYVGIDLERTYARYLHQPFYACSATSLPFADNSFDGVWSIWVLEHIDQPEAVLSEMRRVVRPGGSVFICVAYSVASWVAQGLHKRPYADLALRERLIKTTIPVRSSAPYMVASRLARRVVELASYLIQRQPTALRHTPLQPNFETYWDYDADACVSIDAYSLALYFLSRGDRPYYPAGIVRSLLQRSQPQAYIIQKASV